MKKTYFALTEENSNKTIAVVKTSTGTDGIIKNTSKTKELVALAVKEEWGYDAVEFVDWRYDECNNQMAFDCVTEDGGEEIRVIELSITTLYK